MKKKTLIIATVLSLGLVMGNLKHNFCLAQVSLNTMGNPADVSAAFDIDFANKGLLIPRVSLSSTTDVSTIATPANGLVVYNTNASMTNGNGAGFYYYCSTCSSVGWKYMAAPVNGPGTSGQVLTSQGPTAQPQWSTLSVSGGGPTGCASCISGISSTNSTARTWIGCVDYCKDLTEGGYTDWRMPTWDEAIYYRTSFNTPTGGWLGGYVWTSTPWDARVAGTPTTGTWVIFSEGNGFWDGYGYTSSVICRCVR